MMSNIRWACVRQTLLNAGHGWSHFIFSRQQPDAVGVLPIPTLQRGKWGGEIVSQPSSKLVKAELGFQPLSPRVFFLNH